MTSSEFFITKTKNGNAVEDFFSFYNNLAFISSHGVLDI
jgi:hypothetical protein